MPAPFGRPEDRILDAIRILERRVRRLEAGSRVVSDEISISIPDKRMSVSDDNGNVLVELGLIEDDIYGDTYGIRIRDAAGNTVNWWTALGNFTGVSHLLVAEQPNAVASTSGFWRPGTTSGSYVTLWVSEVIAAGNVIFYDLISYANAQTMATRVLIQGPDGTETLHELTGITATGHAIIEYDTIPDTIYTGDSPVGQLFTVSYQARRTAGASGTVDIYPGKGGLRTIGS